MLPIPQPLLEPGSRALARLLRVPLSTKATVLFGGDVGDDVTGDGDPEPDWLHGAGAQIVAHCDEGGVTLTTRADPNPVPSQRKQWVALTLGKERGVLAAWPDLGADGGGIGRSPPARVLALSSKVAAGHAWWWLWRLQHSVFSRRDSYTTMAREDGSSDIHLSVYRLVGEPASAFDWFPCGFTYGIEKGAIDAFIHYGLAVTVRNLETTGPAPSLDAQTQQAATDTLLALDAATHGIGPAVFAVMLVHDGDEYAALGEMLLPANAAIIPEVSAQLAREQSSAVRAVLTVQQMHTFRLSDMLRAYTEMDASENRALARAEVVGGVVALSMKMKQLAGLGILKLNLTPDTVVFCPDLGEEEGCDDWVLRGFGFRARWFECIQGKPFLWDFDPRLCKQFAEPGGYNANVALVLMALVLLEATRAQCGAVAHAVVREALLCDESPLPAAWESARNEGGTFAALLTQTFQHTRSERDALSSDVLAEVGTDLVAALAAGATTPHEPRFRTLVAALLGAPLYDPAELPTSAEESERRDAQRVQRERFGCLACEHQTRLLARYNQGLGEYANMSACELSEADAPAFGSDRVSVQVDRP